MMLGADHNKIGLNGHQGRSLLSVEQPPQQVDYHRLLELGRELLLALGEDPQREGLLDTPRRWADAWREFIEYDPGRTETCFETMYSGQMICVSGLRVASICEHHLMPFWCNVAIGYIPSEKVLGLSKFARIAHQAAHRLQIQERMGQQIANEICRLIETEDVAVVLKGEHLCMTTRGIRTAGSMTSTIWRGVFAIESERRMEFLHMSD
jgi:GTP cyclohydrolase I